MQFVTDVTGASSQDTRTGFSHQDLLTHSRISVAQAGEVLRQWYRPPLNEMLSMLRIVLSASTSSGSDPQQAFQQLYAAMTLLESSSPNVPLVELHLEEPQIEALKEHMARLEGDVLATIQPEDLLGMLLDVYAAPPRLIGEILELIPQEVLASDRISYAELRDACQQACLRLPEAFGHLQL